jgi:hypothetical protein
VNKKIAAGILSLGFAISHADEVYELNPGETVSDLLVNRLKHNIIYRNHYLQEILKYNNLNLRIARRLRIGKEIKIPSTVIDHIVEKEVSPIPDMESLTPVQEIAPTPSQDPSPATAVFNRWLRFGGVFETLTGKSMGNSVPNDYSLVVVRPILGLGFEGRKDDHELYTSIDTSLVKLSDDSLRIGRDSFFLAAGGLLYRKRLNEDWAFGAIAEYGKEIYIEVKTNQKYEIQTPWILGFGPHFNYKNLGLSYLFVPNQKIVANQTSKENYKILLNYKIKHHENYWEVEGHYGNISTQDSDARNSGAKIQYNWMF